MSLKQRIQDGLNGKYKGLSNGLEDISKYTFGIQKKCYTLIGGLSGTYKTTLLDYMVFSAIEDAKKQNIKLDVFYYSFEIDKLTKQCNWLAQAVYNKYNKVITPEKIKGLGSYRLNSEEEQMVNSCIDEVEEMFDNINFTFRPINPTGIRNAIIDHCSNLGTYTFKSYKDEQGNTKQKKETFTFNEDRYIIVAVDHLYLTKIEQQFTTKQNMDKLSEYLVYLRNMYSISPIIVQQFNDGLNSIERQKYKGVDISPTHNDFKDTRNPYQDADVVFGITNPWKLDFQDYQGYDLKQFKDRFISLKIIKNRLSKDNLKKGMLALPERGQFIELPLANVIDYNKYRI